MPLKKEFSIEIVDINDVSFVKNQKLHRDSCFEFLLFKTGKDGSQIIDFKEYVNTSQSIFIIAPGQAHQLYCSLEETGIIIRVSKEFLEYSVIPFQVNWFFKLHMNPKLTLDNLQFKKLCSRFKKIKEICCEDVTRFKLQKLQKIFGLILFEILEFLPDELDFDFVDTSVSYEFISLVVDNVKEIRSVKKYALSLNTSTNKLEKEVKKHFGRSPINIINELLIIEIKRIYLVEKLSHKEIAFLLKFDSQSSYSRFVKAQTKMTPTELKINLKKNFNA